ncbi:chromate resistance protein ChrB domain-containing protein [Candidatus Thiodictyon syntrophicum]|uniref:chromate resistance protein ChrB domain-containing protein n=1 Tax=Candidatus Thiodictyon syntrophicum TaxID=1166950 RepID=UPI0012FD052C|nr:chromate resistance protein ChrB domain-containing protein [Candidatus Thiodictyon syntrophicum]
MTCALVVWCTAAAPLRAAGQVYSTWDTLEPDKCASIWLIKRHIDARAIFRFYPHGVTIDEGIAFDTPDAKFRRYHNKSTFETLLEHHRLTDPKLRYVGRLIHDIEVNIWERKALAETHEREAALQALLAAADAERSVDLCIDYFDRLSNGASVDAAAP